jgi:DNA replication protein DnaC
MKANLLIVDEVGFQPMTREEASLFFRLVNSRYSKTQGKMSGFRLSPE